MQKNTVHGKRIFTILLVLSMVFFCVFSFDEHAQGVFEDFAAQLCSSSGASSGKTVLKQTDSSRLIDGILSETRTLAELEKEKFEKHSSGLHDNASLYSAAALIWLYFILLAFSLFPADEKQLLPAGYSIISYLHRSDGKKPAFAY